jgi:hypothetical protein
VCALWQMLEACLHICPAGTESFELRGHFCVLLWGQCSGAKGNWRLQLAMCAQSRPMHKTRRWRFRLLGAAGPRFGVAAAGARREPQAAVRQQSAH